VASRLGLGEDHGLAEADGKKDLNENVSDYSQIFTNVGPPAASPPWIFWDKYTVLPGKSIFKLRTTEWFLEKHWPWKILPISQFQKRF